MKQPQVSLIVVCFNQLKYTKKCLTSIIKNTQANLEYELIVIDNGSTDDTASYIKQNYPQAILIKNPDNLGYSKANNQGIEAARGQYIVLLNNDLVVPKNWLAKMVKIAENDPQIGIISSRENFGIIHQNYWPGFIWFTKLLDIILQRPKTVATDNVFGFCLFLRRTLLKQIGLIDEYAFYGDFTDQDLCLRAIAAGYKVVVARDVFIYHYHAKTFNTWTFLKKGVSRKTLGLDYRQYFGQKWSKLNHEKTINNK